MKQRPKWFSALSFVFAGIALSFPFQIGFLYGHGVSELTYIFDKITWLNFLVIFLAATNVHLMWTASPYLKYTLPTMLITVAWNNYIVGSYGGDFTMTTTSLATLAFTALFYPLTQKQIRSLLSNPNKRWWLTPTRVKSHLQTQLHPHVGQNLLAETFDLSESGVYIPLASCRDRRSKDIMIEPDFEVGDLTSIHIHLTQFRTIKCQAKIVRISEEETATHPAGMGLMFLDLDYNSKRYLREHVRELS